MRNGRPTKIGTAAATRPTRRTKNALKVKADAQLSTRANALLMKGEPASARAIFLRLRPRNHWVMSRIASTYYKEDKCEQALKWCQRAMKLAPDCPLVRWDYAIALTQLGDWEVKSVFNRLIKEGVRAILRNPCCEGKSWAESLVNDARLLLAELEYLDQNPGLAEKLLAAHRRHRSRGVSSIYSTKRASDLALYLDYERSRK